MLAVAGAAGLGSFFASLWEGTPDLRCRGDSFGTDLYAAAASRSGDTEAT
jgi:hypothetical protein